MLEQVLRWSVQHARLYLYCLHSQISTKRDADTSTESDVSSARDTDRFSASDSHTPATENFDDSINHETERLKKQLNAANAVINQQKRELEESRNFKHTMDQALPSPSEADFPRNERPNANIQR